jgi:hypothetical protein
MPIDCIYTEEKTMDEMDWKELKSMGLSRLGVERCPEEIEYNNNVLKKCLNEILLQKENEKIEELEEDIEYIKNSRDEWIKNSDKWQKLFMDTQNFIIGIGIGLGILYIYQKVLKEKAIY